MDWRSTSTSLAGADGGVETIFFDVDIRTIGWSSGLALAVLDDGVQHLCVLRPFSIFPNFLLFSTFTPVYVLLFLFLFLPSTINLTNHSLFSTSTGFTNSSLFTGDIEYHNIPSGAGTYWIQSLTTLTVNSQSVSLPPSSNSESFAAIDTGTTLIGGPPEIIDAIYKNVPNSQALSGNSEGYYSFPCSQSVNSAMGYGDGGTAWSIDPDDFKAFEIGSTGMCVGAFFALDLGGGGSGGGIPSWIVGDSFLPQIVNFLESRFVLWFSLRPRRQVSFPLSLSLTASYSTFSSTFLALAFVFSLRLPSFSFAKNVYSVYRFSPPSVGFAALSDTALSMNGASSTSTSTSGAPQGNNANVGGIQAPLPSATTEVIATVTADPFSPSSKNGAIPTGMGTTGGVRGNAGNGGVTARLISMSGFNLGGLGYLAIPYDARIWFTLCVGMSLNPYHRYAELSLYFGGAGALLLGHTVSSLLFGILTLQTYLYYDKFSNDPKRFRSAVAVVWLLEFGHFISVFAEMWIDMVKNYGKVDFLVAIPRALAISLLIAAFVMLIYTLVFADRVYRMSKNPYIYSFLCIAAVIRAIIGIANFGAIWTSTSIDGYLHRWRWLIPMQLGFGLLTDAVISITLVVYLRRRDGNMNPRTTRIMDTLMWWSIESSVSTVVLGIASLVTILVLSSTLVWIALLLVITRVYSNVLLASLNGRAKLREINSGGSVVLRTNPTTISAPIELQSGSIYPMSPIESKSYGTAM
ncbi:hypothetical protein D9758_017739 [Tetrapyrgos nigripes]|uniref:Peptidase A1 domain-containing protein n=1 Tax=Tetrapyrgos nigripes TaxID=182062 RepID=A0A8H5BKL6_9AGAR|nr:hypothetical protein D9758_017739 [Tetrapyrgos nigripes]